MHYATHKAACKEYSKYFLHCVVCDRTVDVHPCTNCYKVVLCDRESCLTRHSENGVACTPPLETTEMAVLADVTIDNQGEPSILCEDGVTRKGTMKGILTMLMLMQNIPFLIDRIQLVYVRFGGVITTTPEFFSENFECEGPLLGVSFSNRIEYRVCADGMERIPATTLNLSAGAGGPVFDMHQATPLSVGRNLLKVQIAVVPVEHTTPARQPRSRG